MKKERIEKRVLVGLIVLLMAIIGSAQQQQPGSAGNSVTVSNATLAVTQSGTWNTRLQDGSGNAVTSTGAALDVNLKSGSIANTAFGVNSGTAKIGIVYPYTSCGTTAFETGTPAGLAAMPTSSTAVAAASTCVVSMTISNTSAGALNVTVSDNAGTPINFLNAFTMPAGSTSTYNFPNGMKFNAGIKVQASGAGVTYYIEGVQ